MKAGPGDMCCSSGRSREEGGARPRAVSQNWNTNAVVGHYNMLLIENWCHGPSLQTKIEKGIQKCWCLSIPWGLSVHVPAAEASDQHLIGAMPASFPWLFWERSQPCQECLQCYSINRKNKDCGIDLIPPAHKVFSFGKPKLAMDFLMSSCIRHGMARGKNWSLKEELLAQARLLVGSVLLSLMNPSLVSYKVAMSPADTSTKCSILVLLVCFPLCQVQKNYRNETIYIESNLNEKIHTFYLIVENNLTSP